MSIISGGNEPNKIRVGTQEVKAVYAGSNLVWRQKFTASGGTITDSGGYRYHTFNSDGTFVVTSGEKSVEYVIVGGGGGGGFGGGGGGAVVQGSATLNSSKSITVGAGGAKGDRPGSDTQVLDNRGSSGGQSSIAGVRSADGGGGGGGGGTGKSTSPFDNTIKNARNGGCGGGGAAWYGNGAPGQGSVGYSGGQGNDDDGNPHSSAGGGGMSSAGITPVRGAGGGNGGSSITVWGKSYAGGGGGGHIGGSPPTSSGGGAGAGNGGNDSSHGQNATANTGSGGGGCGGQKFGSTIQGGNGGSGVVVIRYQTPVRSAVKEALKRKASQNENAEEEGHKA